MESINGLDIENKDELLTGIKSVETELNETKSKYRRKDKELLDYKGLVKDAGYDSESGMTKKEFLESLKQTRETVTTTNLTNEELTMKLSLLESQYKESQAKVTESESEAKELKSQNILSTMKSKTTSALSEGKISASNYVADSLIANGTIKMLEDEVVFMENGEVISFDTGIKNFIDSHEDLQSRPQNNGKGLKSEPSKQVQSGKYTFKDFEQMTSEEVKTNATKLRIDLGV